MQSTTITKGLTERLNEWVHGTWNVNESGEIDVAGRVYITDYVLEELPVVFGRVEGLFMCRRAHLLSLKGFPQNCKQLIFDNCLLPSHYYTGALEQQLTIEEYLLQNFLHLEPEKKEIELVAEYFPEVSHRYRGYIAGKKFGF